MKLTMKKTTLFVCMQLALIASTNVNAKSRQKSYNSNYNQLYINDQSLRQQQNDIAKKLNNLQSYTQEQNKIYDEAIEGLIKENDQLISLNENMLAEIERLNNEVISLKETTETNRSNIAALTKAVTKKVKNIQEYIDKQEQGFNNLSNKGKLLLIGLCILSLLLSALLWSLIRKQNKKTMKLKAEVERVLNQIQANTDSSMATWAEQQTDTLNIWKNDFHTQMTEVIQQTIKDTTHSQIQELQKVADANIAAERLKLESMLAEKQSEEESLNLSQLSRNNDIDDLAKNEVVHQINKDQSLNAPSNQATVDTGNFSSSSLLNEIDSVMTEETNSEIDMVNDVINDMNHVTEPNNPKPMMVDLDSQVKEKPDNNADDIFAVLDSQTAEFAAKADVTMLNMDRVIIDDVEDELDDEEVSLADLEAPVVTDNIHDDMSLVIDKEVETLQAADVSSPSLEMMKQIDAFNTHTSDEEAEVDSPSFELPDEEKPVEFVLPVTENHMETETQSIVSDKESLIETTFSNTESNQTDINKVDLNQADLSEEVGLDKAIVSSEFTPSFSKSRYTNVEKDVVIEQVNPIEQYNLAMSSENSGNIDTAINQYEKFVNDFEFKTDAETSKLVGLALDKKAKLLLSGNKVNEAINAYDALISHYENSTENSQLQILSEAILNSSLLELIHTGSINGSKVGTARSVFKNSPQNMLAMEAFETLRLSTRRDVSNTQKDLLQKYEDVDLIPLDWSTMENWANGLNDKTKTRTLETIQFFKNWNGQPSVFS